MTNSSKPKAIAFSELMPIALSRNKYPDSLRPMPLKLTGMAAKVPTNGYRIRQNVKGISRLSALPITTCIQA